MGIIVVSDKLIHCTQHMGEGVIVSFKTELLEIYDLAPKLCPHQHTREEPRMSGPDVKIATVCLDCGHEGPAHW